MTKQAVQPARLKQLERIVEISRFLSSTHDLAHLLQAVVDVACELTNSEGASILLFDPATGELRFEAAPDIQKNSLKTINVPLDSSVAGWVFTHGRPMVLQDASSDPRVYREVDRTLRSQTKSLLGVPLMVKQKPIGVIEAVNKKDQGQYTQDDLTILETLSGQAAIAIENARLFERTQRALDEVQALHRQYIQREWAREARRTSGRRPGFRARSCARRRCHRCRRSWRGGSRGGAG